MKKLDIIFMGTPAFGATILEALIKHHNVKLVVTQTDKVNGKKVYVSPVKELAIKEGIKYCLKVFIVILCKEYKCHSFFNAYFANSICFI